MSEGWIWIRTTLVGPNKNKHSLTDAQLGVWKDLSVLGITDVDRKLKIEDLFPEYLMEFCATEYKERLTQTRYWGQVPDPHKKAYTVGAAGEQVLEPGVEHFRLVAFRKY